jgi:hypothetical protein
VSASYYDAASSAVRAHVEDLAVWLAIWETRCEPDAHVRRCASDAVDATLAELYGIRARLIGETRAANDATAIRADALLAGGPAATRTRD